MKKVILQITLNWCKLFIYHKSNNIVDVELDLDLELFGHLKGLDWPDVVVVILFFDLELFGF